MLQHQKAASEVGEDQDQLFELMSKMIRECVPDQWTEDEFKNEVSLSLATFLHDEIMRVSGATKGGLEDAAETEAKNS